MNENNISKLKVIVTGATGMVGEGVLIECLQNDRIEEVMVVGRKPCGVTHPKLKEIICEDFFNLKDIENKLSGYDACYFCLGISSIGMKEPEYFKVTYTLTLAFAQMLSNNNPNMTFCYVSGAATDGSEKGKVMWARVKGKTENDLTNLSFKQVFNFRPAFMKPTKGQKNALSFYKYVIWMFPALNLLFPNYVSTLREVGLAMINVTLNGYNKAVLEVKDIKQIAKM